MKKQTGRTRAAAAVLLAALLMLAGCESMLEREYAVSSQHPQATTTTQSAEVIRVTTIGEVMDILAQTVRQGTPELTVQLKDFVTDEWLKGLFSLNGTSDPTLRRIVPKMYAAIPKRTIVASIEIDGRMVASGLGIRDRDWVGIYAIYVSPSCWSRGYARAVCSTVLREAWRLGAKRAYLQVASGNRKARRLYESLGFTHFYSYWFRSNQGRTGCDRK